MYWNVKQSIEQHNAAATIPKTKTAEWQEKVCFFVFFLFATQMFIYNLLKSAGGGDAVRNIKKQRGFQNEVQRMCRATG